MKFNNHKKISDKAKQMYVGVNALRSDLTKLAEKHFDDSFKNEGFTYNSLWKWQPRKRPDRQRHKILQKTGKLRRSIKSKVFTTKDGFEIRFKSNLVYAKIHNEGLMGKAWGKHSFKMPKRQFMGYSRVLDLRIRKIFDSRITKIFKS
jgi:phage gpG-like protein